MLTQQSYIPVKTGRTERWLIRKKINMHQAWWIVISVINVMVGVYVAKTELLASTATALSISNLFLAVLIRNELILHLLYRLAVILSRRIVSSKYHINAGVHYIGGVHAACATWSFVWLLIDILRNFGTLSNPVLIVTSWMLPILLLSIILTALPPFREKFHNTFEKVHRYIGWLCLAVLSLHLIVSRLSTASSQIHRLQAFLTDPVLLMTALIIISVCLPWMTIQRFERFTAYCPSPDVLVLTIPGKADVGTFARISTNLVEWHSFSVAGIRFNPQTGRSELRLIIGAAGDWTRNLAHQIEQGNLPKCLWVRRVKPPGFMFSIQAYSRVLVIATGAGIAPVLPHVEKNGHKLCILWIGNDHQKTYGDEVWSTLAAHPRFKVYDTGLYGRPHVGELAIQTAREFGVQAVFCVSNKGVTKAIVNACLDKGIPAYGATWDS